MIEIMIPMRNNLTEYDILKICIFRSIWSLIGIFQFNIKKNFFLVAN